MSAYGPDVPGEGRGTVAGLFDWLARGATGQYDRGSPEYPTVSTVITTVELSQDRRDLVAILQGPRERAGRTCGYDYDLSAFRRDDIYVLYITPVPGDWPDSRPACQGGTVERRSSTLSLPEPVANNAQLYDSVTAERLTVR